MRMTLEDIKRHEKRSAAIHEAGHLTIYATYGNEGGDDRDERTWLGTCEAPRQHFTPVAAVAGIVAECWADDPQIAPFEILEMLEDKLLLPSQTDMRHFPPYEELEPTISEALALLNEHKAFFDCAVVMLVEREVVTIEMAREQFIQTP